MIKDERRTIDVRLGSLQKKVECVGATTLRVHARPRTGPLSMRAMKGATWGGRQGPRQHAQSRNRNIVRLTASVHTRVKPISHNR